MQEPEPSTPTAAADVTAKKDASRCHTLTAGPLTNMNVSRRREQHRWSLLSECLKSQRGECVDSSQARTNYRPCTAMITREACTQILLSKDEYEHYSAQFQGKLRCAAPFSVF